MLGSIVARRMLSPPCNTSLNSIRLRPSPSRHVCHAKKGAPKKGKAVKKGSLMGEVPKDAGPQLWRTTDIIMQQLLMVESYWYVNGYVGSVIANETKTIRRQLRVFEC